MDTWVWHQVGLELRNINIEGTIETKGSRQRRDNLSDQPVQVGVRWAFNIQVASADIVQRLVIDLVSYISVFQEGMDAQDGVVWFDNGGGNLRTAPHGERDLRFLTVIDGQSLQHEASQTRSSTTTDGMVDQETLKTRTVIGQLTDAIQAQIDNFLTDSVVTTGEVVCGIFLTRDQLFRMEQLTVGSRSDFIDDGRLQIDKDGTWDVLSGTSFREKGVEGVITTTDSLIGRHLTIGLDTVLEAKQLPASITDLDTGLTDVNSDSFTHGWFVFVLLD